mmetsp:Transcript_10693/g.36986  ORF Transcript_10693/g.36986 Transcript_10693/m.36986 type:complete len:214 (+) Transcript_10693:714-1355(+)
MVRGGTTKFSGGPTRTTGSETPSSGRSSRSPNWATRTSPPASRSLPRAASRGAERATSACPLWSSPWPPRASLAGASRASAGHSAPPAPCTTEVLPLVLPGSTNAPRVFSARIPPRPLCAQPATFALSAATSPSAATAWPWATTSNWREITVPERPRRPSASAPRAGTAPTQAKRCGARRDTTVRSRAGSLGSALRSQTALPGLRGTTSLGTS